MCPLYLTKFDILSHKNYKVNNWSQKIHTITPYIEFKHIEGKENILADSLPRLKTLGLYETNTPEKEGHENSKSVFNLETQMVCSVDGNQNIAKILKLMVSNINMILNRKMTFCNPILQ